MTISSLTATSTPPARCTDLPCRCRRNPSANPLLRQQSTAVLRAAAQSGPQILAQFCATAPAHVCSQPGVTRTTETPAARHSAVIAQRPAVSSIVQDAQSLRVCRPAALRTMTRDHDHTQRAGARSRLHTMQRPTDVHACGASMLHGGTGTRQPRPDARRCR